ncbi:MAG: molybdenum cofactor guanylyltransferase [Bacteroidota bacterium]
MSNTLNDTVALILCGGYSSRMGVDKGLKETNGTPWAQQLHQQLSAIRLTTYLSVRPDQTDAYHQRLPDIPLITDEVLTGINGPLRGILSAHRQFTNKHLLLVPCDMPLLVKGVFALWMKTFQEQGKTVISRTEKRFQPLCGIYHQLGLFQLDELYQQQKLVDQSMHDILDNYLQPYYLDILGDMVAMYQNLNTPQDKGQGFSSYAAL